MTEDKMLLIVSAMIVLGTALYFARMWVFRTGFGGGRAMRISRIVEDDGHLDFDQRLAQRLGELERQRGSEAPPPPAPSQSPAPPAPPPAPSAAPSGFGRRGL